MPFRARLDNRLRGFSFSRLTTVFPSYYSTGHAKPRRRYDAMSPDSLREKKSEWDKDYDSPNANIIPVSADRVGSEWMPGLSARKGERWHQRDSHVHLMSFSDFVKHHLECSANQAIEQAPISLDHDAVIVRHFVNLIYARKTTTVDFDIPQFKQLLALCDQFQAEPIVQSAAQAMKDKLARHPYPRNFSTWHVFKLAAQLDDVELARCAVANLERSGQKLDEIVLLSRPSFFEGPPPPRGHTYTHSSGAPPVDFSTSHSTVPSTSIGSEEVPTGRSQLEARLTSASRGRTVTVVRCECVRDTVGAAPRAFCSRPLVTCHRPGRMAR